MNYRFKEGSAREHFQEFRNFIPVGNAIHDTYFRNDHIIQDWFKYSFVRGSPEDRTEFVDLVEPFGKGKMDRKVLEASEDFFRFGRELIGQYADMKRKGALSLCFIASGIAGLIGEDNIVPPLMASVWLPIIASLVPEREPLPDGMSPDWLNNYLGFHAEAVKRSRRADKELAHEMPHLRRAVLD